MNSISDEWPNIGDMKSVCYLRLTLTNPFGAIILDTTACISSSLVCWAPVGTRFAYSTLFGPNASIRHLFSAEIVAPPTP